MTSFLLLYYCSGTVMVVERYKRGSRMKKTPKMKAKFRFTIYPETKQQLAQIKAAAKLAGQTASTFIVRAAESAAKKSQEVA